MNVEEIKFEDIKFPFGVNNKNFIKKIGDNFIINSKGGGDFFPNPIDKKINKIDANKQLIICQVIMIILFLLFCFFLNIYPTIWTIIILLFSFFVIGIILIICLSLFNIKTEFVFSPEGINISSKKGKLFISKDDIKSVELIKERKQNMNRKECTHVYIVIHFNKFVYIPYINSNELQIKFLNDYYFSENEFFGNSNKMFLEYIVQEIKKALEFKL